MIKDENYIQIAGWMLNELNLKGNELLIYALIHGFCQDGKSTFKGGLTYIGEWTNSTKQGVIKALKSLLDKKLIVKVLVQNKNGMQSVEYFTVKSRGGKQSLPGEGSTKFTTIQEERGKQSLPGGSTEFTGGGKQSLPNNTNNKNLRNSTAPGSAKTDGEAINEVKEKTEAAEDFIFQTLKSLFGGHYVFDDSFVTEILSLSKQFKLSEKDISQYLKFVFEKASEKKPNSLTNMYYKMAKSAAIMQDFVLSVQKDSETSEKNTTFCPVCNSRANIFGNCPNCGFSMFDRDDENIISLKKQIFELPESKRISLEEEYKAEILRQSSYGIGAIIKNPTLKSDFEKRISEIYSKYGITA